MHNFSSKLLLGAGVLLTTILSSQSSQAVSFPDYTFGCRNSVLQAIYQVGTSSEKRFPLIEFTEDPERCEVVSARFRTANEQNQLKLLVGREVDSEYVIYGRENSADQTPAFLLTLIRTENKNTPEKRENFIKQLSKNLRSTGDYPLVLLQE